MSTTRTPSPYAITIALIAINTLVFLAMVTTGISFTQPTPLDVATWGGDFGPLTLGAHQYWRLFTSTFLHFGIIHIAFNMYVLYQIGPFIEITFGRLRYLVIYLFAGLAGSVVSVLVHPLSVGAGASGAIFGLYGAVFGYLLIQRRNLNPAAVKSIAKSAGIFGPIQRRLRLPHPHHGPLRPLRRPRRRLPRWHAPRPPQHHCPDAINANDNAVTCAPSLSSHPSLQLLAVAEQPGLSPDKSRAIRLERRPGTHRPMPVR